MKESSPSPYGELINSLVHNLIFIPNVPYVVLHLYVAVLALSWVPFLPLIRPYYPVVHWACRTTSSPSQPLILLRRCWKGDSSLMANTRAAFSTSPKPPLLLGKVPISCGGIRCAASWSFRLVFWMCLNSSFATTSASWISCNRSFLPFAAD